MRSQFKVTEKSNNTPFKITKILVAIDGSNISLNAATAAIQIAEKYGAELVILYVIDSRIRYESVGEVTFPKFLGSLKQVVDIAMEKGQNLVDEVKQKANGKSINIKTEVI